jgi:hypothetical protein
MLMTGGTVKREDIPVGVPILHKSIPSDLFSARSCEYFSLAFGNDKELTDGRRLLKPTKSP